jgi:cytochrome b6-f complex iron-sulfur subunit
VIAAGCGTDSPGTGVDSGVDPDGGGGGTGFAMCGANVCVDLADPANVGLNTVGGARVVAIGTNKISVVRTSDTAFTTLTAVCTHAGCTVKYASTTNSFNCPCHGSKFDIAGMVTRGPAINPLKTFTNTFDAAGMLLTINL